MLNGLFTTYSGKFVNARRLEIISNNLANVSTAGFKASRPVFNSITNEEIMVADQLENTYASVYDSYLNFEGGMPVETGSELDFAIEGDGFFVISTKEGLRYTRNGKFTIDHEKRLVTAGGDPVLGRGHGGSRPFVGPAAGQAGRRGPHAGAQVEVFRVDSRDVPRAAQVRVAGGLRGLHGQPLGPRAGSEIHRKPAQAPPAADLPG